MQKFKNREEYEQWKAARLGYKSELTPQPIKKERPSLCLAIGIGFIILAIILILNSIEGLIKGIEFQAIDMSLITQMNEEMPFPFTVVLFIFQHLMGLSLLQIAFAAFILIAAIAFLKMRPWARTTLEAVSWFILITVVIVGLFISFSWVSIVSAINVQAGSNHATASFTMFGVVLGLVITLFLSAIPITAIVLLHCKTIRKAFPR